MEQFEQENPEISTQNEHFSHAKFAFIATLTIFFGYQIAGGTILLLSQKILGLENYWLGILQGIGQILFMLIPTIIVVKYSPLGFSGLFRLHERNMPTLQQWSLGLAGIVALQIFSGGFTSLQEHLIPEKWQPMYKALEDQMENLYRLLLGGSSVLDIVRALAVGALIPAIAEESLFRGLLQRSLEEVRKPISSIIITALLFGVLHFHPFALVPLVLIGGYLGFLAQKTRSLILPIALHFCNNAFAVAGMYFSNGEAKQDLPMLTAFALTICSLIAFGVVVFAFWKTETSVNEKNSC